MAHIRLHMTELRIQLQCRRHRTCGFDPWAGKLPWRRAGQYTPVFLPAESQGQRSLVCSSPSGRKESDAVDVTEHSCTRVQLPFMSVRKMPCIFFCLSHPVHISFLNLTYPKRVYSQFKKKSKQKLRKIPINAH